MNNQSRKQITEDTPQYRSVMIQQPSMGAAPPLMPRPSALASLPSLKRSAVHIKQDNKVNIVGGELQVWKVTDLIPLPSMHRLERTNVYVDGTAQEVADRICSCLQRESIAATFSDDDQNRLTAETNDSVKFCVRLFADQGKVVVEAQRIVGCAYSFHQSCKAVLRSAKGLKAPAKRTFTLPKCIPKETPEQKQKCMMDGLKIALNLFNQDRLDARLLAMQSLEQMTRTSAFAAKVLLTGPFLKTLIDLVEAHKAPNSDAESLPEIEARHMMSTHRLALTILANSLNELDKSGELQNVLSMNTEVFQSEQLSTALLTDLNAACDKPHESCQAARCIHYLVKSSSSLKDQLINQGALKVVSYACSQGTCRSAMLERESKKLRIELQQ